jgi:undecaprenyl-diphosphatase
MVTSLATTLALLAVQWQEVLRLLKKFFSKAASPEKNEVIDILGSTLVVALFGFLVRDIVSDGARHLTIVSIGLLIGSLLMLSAVLYAGKKDANPRATLWLMGSAQVLALFPGVSRSGATISVALLRGMSIKEAARRSFLLSLPISFLASLAEIAINLQENGLGIFAGQQGLIYLLGFITSFIVGYASLRWLLKSITETGFRPYIIYRGLLIIAVGIAIYLGVN